jgi:hypothetical protein
MANVNIVGWTGGNQNKPFIQGDSETNSINWGDFYNGIIAPAKPVQTDFSHVPNPPIDWDAFYKSVGVPHWWWEDAPPATPPVALPPLPRPRPWWAPQPVPGVGEAPMPVDSDVPLNAGGWGRARAAIKRIIPATFKSSNTGQTVTVGETYKGTDGYSYLAKADGTFENLGYSTDEKLSRAARGKAIGDANRSSASPTYDVAGNNNAFSPTSVQNSVRWQTGY